MFAEGPLACGSPPLDRGVSQWLAESRPYWWALQTWISRAEYNNDHQQPVLMG